ncbi:phage baseplate plug family protein [Ereboglobus luteus]|uniref:Cyanophage baseplate Pam3 plug gp18 domain-containing protein n=1 Tax=Ereboglobus luteus TaxID=1796921 RepID=A0A2U8E664_9BACT|nr:hypothetical protein [Ereboglobus luteus]AWI10316.1 hypothetical protein CKA38_14580 [Ereboglobus luteus]
MKLIPPLSDSPRQRFSFVLEDNRRVDFTLQYVSQQRGWFFDLDCEDDFALSGIRLVSSQNILRPWRAIIPFGLAVVTLSEGEPMRQSDLADGTVKLYILEGTDIDYIENLCFARK